MFDIFGNMLTATIQVTAFKKAHVYKLDYIGDFQFLFDSYELPFLIGFDIVDVLLFSPEGCGMY